MGIRLTKYNGNDQEVIIQKQANLSVNEETPFINNQDGWKDVTHISSGAFANISELVTLIIPDTVTHIEEGAIVNCPNARIFCNATIKPEGWHENFHDGNNVIVLFGVPEEKSNFVIDEKGGSPIVPIYDYVLLEDEINSTKEGNILLGLKKNESLISFPFIPNEPGNYNFDLSWEQVIFTLNFVVDETTVATHQVLWGETLGIVLNNIDDPISTSGDDFISWLIFGNQLTPDTVFDFNFENIGTTLIIEPLFADISLLVFEYIPEEDVYDVIHSDIDEDKYDDGEAVFYVPAMYNGSNGIKEIRHVSLRPSSDIHVFVARSMMRKIGSILIEENSLNNRNLYTEYGSLYSGNMSWALFLKSVQIPEGFVSVASNFFNTGTVLREVLPEEECFDVIFPSTIEHIGWDALYNNRIKKIILPDTYSDFSTMRNCFRSINLRQFGNIPNEINIPTSTTLLMPTSTTAFTFAVDSEFIERFLVHENLNIINFITHYQRNVVGHSNMDVIFDENRVFSQTDIMYFRTTTGKFYGGVDNSNQGNTKIYETPKGQIIIRASATAYTFLHINLDGDENNDLSLKPEDLLELIPEDLPAKSNYIFGGVNQGTSNGFWAPFPQRNYRNVYIKTLHNFRPHGVGSYNAGVNNSDGLVCDEIIVEDNTTDTISVSSFQFSGVKKLTIQNGDNIKFIEASAFRNSIVEELNFDTSFIEEIGVGAFRDSKLSGIFSFDNLNDLGGTAVFYSSNVNEVHLKESFITNLPVDTFRYCEELTFVSLPSTLSTISSRAFEDCSSLIEIEIHAITPPTITSQVFNRINANVVVKVPQGSKTDYENATYWSFLTIEEME